MCNALGWQREEQWARERPFSGTCETLCPLAVSQLVLSPLASTRLDSQRSYWRLRAQIRSVNLTKSCPIWRMGGKNFHPSRWPRPLSSAPSWPWASSQPVIWNLQQCLDKSRYTKWILAMCEEPRSVTCWKGAGNTYEALSCAGKTKCLNSKCMKMCERQ